MNRDRDPREWSTNRLGSAEVDRVVCGWDCDEMKERALLPSQMKRGIL